MAAFWRCLLAVGLFGAQGAHASSSSSAISAAYTHFRMTIGEDRGSSDRLGFEQRVELFRRRVEAVDRHNADPRRSWTAGINRFADYSDEEFQALLGHRHSRRRGQESAASASATSFLEVRQHRALAATVDWRKSLNSTADVKDQGSCGSCWAVAAVGTLEAHGEMHKPLPGRMSPLSFEQLVDCVQNPQECGGQSGCKGATAELAFEWVAQHGVVAADDYEGYMSGGNGACKTSARPVMHMQGFQRLPENKLQPLMEAVASKGPVVVSVDAREWNMYQTGVFDTCVRNAIVNHAVMLAGYGTERQGEDPQHYWLVRNSWGKNWGEDGYVRVLRHASDVGEEGYCGIDNSPQEGVGCKGGPTAVPVCGMCGILADSSLPVNVRPANPAPTH